MTDKSISALLNGIARKDYYGEKEITTEFLKEEIFPQETEENFIQILEKYQTLLKSIMYSNMELKQLEAYLTAQAKKKEDFLNESQISSIIKFWRNNKEKLNQVMIEKSSFSDRLRKINYKIDLKYNKDDLTPLDPKVVFNISTSKRNEDENKQFSFECDLESLNELINKVSQIEKKIESLKQ